MRPPIAAAIAVAAPPIVEAQHQVGASPTTPVTSDRKWVLWALVGSAVMLSLIWVAVRFGSPSPTVVVNVAQPAIPAPPRPAAGTCREAQSAASAQCKQPGSAARGTHHRDAAER